jgi:two-component system, sensor histidine kinase and response regulator
MFGKVLVIENDLTTRWTIAQRFEELGVDADCAANGYEALHVLSKEHYDLVLVDLEMPGMDGFEFTRFVREREDIHGKQINIIAMSNISSRVTCLSAGMNDYVHKPLASDELHVICRTWLHENAIDTNTVPSS